MVFPIHQIHVPIEQDETGELFVEGTRVPIDIIISEFKNGTTPEQLAQNFDALHLSDIYAVIGYYLQHKIDVEMYLLQQETALNQTREATIERFQLRGIRETLLARQNPLT